MKHRVLAALAAWSVVVTGFAVSAGVPAAAAEYASTAVAQAADAGRVLLDDDFSSNDGAGWLTTTSNAAASVTFSGEIATIKGGGAENRMVSKADILAQDFTLSLDLFINAGNTNSAVKIGFLSTESASNRHQVTWDGPNKRLRLERIVNGTATVLGTANNVSLPVNTGAAAHHVEVNVDGDRVRILIGGDLMLDVADAETGSAAQGRIMFAGQFPRQDFSVDNVRVTTTEAVTVGRYAVAVATETNGVRDTDSATAGGTLSANRASGDPGDIVTLTYTVAPGYIFDGYESLRLDTGTSTDGLLTITDDRFALDDKTGSVIIIAKFVTEPNDPNVVFKDYFSGTFNETGLYTVQGSGISVADGALRIDPASGSAAAIVDSATWSDTVAYRIETDARKLDGTPGTMQVAFRGDSFADRYVLALNGSKALLRRIDAQGANVELASTLYAFDQRSRRLVIDVTEDTVSVTSDGSPVLSYVNTDDADRDRADWSGLGAGLSLINMTAGAPVAFDNVKVARVPVRVSARVDVTIDGIADVDRAAGAVVLSTHRTSAGNTLRWTVHPKGGYVFTGMSVGATSISGNEYAVPDDTTSDITLVADFTKTEVSAKTYYIDSLGGDDANSGTAADQAWAGLAMLDRTFQPGDQILLRRGSVFDGKAAALAFRGSGTAKNPIVVGAYGEGDLPQLNAAGQVENVVSLSNQEHITISHLEITNTHPGFESGFALNTSTNREKNLRAVNVSARDFGVVHGIRITDLFIHDVNGNLAAKWNGGIFFDIGAEVAEGELHGVPTKYDDVRIERNVLERVDRSGIKLVSSAWANQSLVNAPNVPLNWFPSTNVVIRDNQLRYMGGDAITVRDTDGTLIEYNLARHSRYQNTGYNAGIWPFETTNTVIQHNEVSHTHGVQDGQGFDTDHVSAYTVMQYNYSHDNEGGFMLIMNGFPHTAPTIRYNVSQNDADKTFEFARGTAAGTMIYNNTISSDTLLQGPRGGVLDLANSGAGTGNREVFIFNNVFDYPEGQKFYVGEAATMKTKAKLFNNAYTGGIGVPAEEEQAITGDLGLPGLGTAPDDAAGTLPLAGVNVGDHFAGYVPVEKSPLRDAGVSIDEVMAHFGGTLTDRRDMTPTEIHSLALQGESIDFVAGHFLPDVEGVRYDVDFLGTRLPRDINESPLQPGALDIGPGEQLTVGAVQYAESEPGEEPGEGEGDGEGSGNNVGDGEDTSGAPSADSDNGGELPRTGAEWPLAAMVLAGLLLLLGWRLKRSRGAM